MKAAVVSIFALVSTQALAGVHYECVSFDGDTLTLDPFGAGIILSDIKVAPVTWLDWTSATKQVSALTTKTTFQLAPNAQGAGELVVAKTKYLGRGLCSAAGCDKQISAKFTKGSLQNEFDCKEVGE